MPELPDRWAAASTYEDFMGRWSRPLAVQFVDWLQVPPGLAWLEIGCGTGALTSAICAKARPASVVACDPVTSFIEYARSRFDDERITFSVAGADALPMSADGYGSITSLLALNFFPDPEAALRRMYAAGSAGCVISACVWDYAGGMQFLRYFWDAAREIDPAAAQYDEGVRFTICTPDRLRGLFVGGELFDVHCEPIEIITEFSSFEDYWKPLLGGTGPAPSFVASLGPGDRARLRRTLENVLPVAGDGRIRLSARAWAVRGVKT